MLTPPVAGQVRVPVLLAEALRAWTPAVDPLGRLKVGPPEVVLIVAEPVASYEPIAGIANAKPLTTS